MKKKLSVLLALVCLTTLLTFCLSSCGSNPVEYKSGSYRYIEAPDGVIITEYIGEETDVTIPDTIRGMPVVGIGSSAFSHHETIKSVTIPDSVVSIDSSVFSHCKALESVTLGSGIREIDFSVFSYCNLVKYNEYENGFYLGNEENPYLAFVSVKYKGAPTMTIHPDTVIICGSAFENCFALSELIIPDGVKSIGAYALHYAKLKTLYIPKSVESIGFHIFWECNTIQNIIVSDENPHFKSVDGSLFSRDGSRLIKYALGQTASTYQVPDGTVTIETGAFENAQHLIEVTLPDSLETIGNNAFQDCKNMSSVTLGNSLKTIESGAFASCSSLTEIVIPDSVEALGGVVFGGCSKLESAVIGSGVKDMDYQIFARCDSLKEVTFRDPEGWRAKTMYMLFYKKPDLSDPERNAVYLTEDYCGYFWSKK